MFGLVDYEVSSESENDEPAAKPTPKAIEQIKTEGKNYLNLFTSLPAPIKKESVEEVADEYMNKKATVVEKPPKRIKIDIPQLDSFEEEEFEPIPKEKKKKCGLFSILPSAKVVPLKNTCFLPNSLKKSGIVSKPTVSTPKLPKVLKKTIVPQATQIPTRDHYVSDSDSEGESSYVPQVQFDEETWNELFTKKKRIALPKPKAPIAQKEEQSFVVDAAPEAEKPYKGLNNEEFKELIGKREKEKKINIIDIEEAKIHPDREEWLKSLTDPSFEASAEIKEPVNRTSLVKNHITSLAERALANDKDLQIKWAESRHSRNTTRTKYGF